MSVESRNAAIVRMMNEFGIMNHLYASLLASIGRAVQDSDIAILKRSKEISTTRNHQIAAFLVFKYMTQHKLDETRRCIADESDGQIASNVPPDFADQTLATLINDWLAIGTRAVLPNLANLRRRVAERLERLGGGHQEEEEEEEPLLDPLGGSMTATNRQVPQPYQRRRPRVRASLQRDRISEWDSSQSDDS
jgi:hypothetical protein